MDSTGRFNCRAIWVLFAAGNSRLISFFCFSVRWLFDIFSSGAGSVISTSSTKVFLKYLSEMEPVDSEGDGLWKEAGTAEHGPYQKSPVIESLFSDDPQNNDRPYECGDVVETEMK